MTLTQKESSLIKDLKGQEKLCIDKYTRHAACAKDPQLKTLFTQMAQTEQEHLNTLTQIESGNVPQMNANSGGCNPSAQSCPNGQCGAHKFTATYAVAGSPDKDNDCFLCTDMLATEKHASGLYDTCIFEFKDEGVRTALNHIQKEEQEHGKKIYDYMAVNAMYAAS